MTKEEQGQSRLPRVCKLTCSHRAANRYPPKAADSKERKWLVLLPLLLLSLLDDRNEEGTQNNKRRGSVRL
jgi:hypothetical protein